MAGFPIRQLILPVLAMTIVVVASNILVEHPFTPFGLGDYLTWGAFTYPVSFLVTDLTNRRYGASTARLLVAVGFVIAVALSYNLATPQIALASGTAFIVGQLLDISVFNRLRRQTWWLAPLFGSVIGSALDTAIFFSLAFGADPEMASPVNFMHTQLPLWQSLAVCDFLVKMLVALLALLPYGALLTAIRPVEAVEPVASH